MYPLAVQNEGSVIDYLNIKKVIGLQRIYARVFKLEWTDNCQPFGSLTQI